MKKSRRLTIAQQEAIFRAYENEIRYQIRINKRNSIIYFISLCLFGIFYILTINLWN